MKAKFCTNCGKTVREGARFCSGCGSPVRELPDEVPVTTETPQEESVPAAAEVILPEPVVEEVVPEPVAEEPAPEPVAEEAIPEPVTQEPAPEPVAEPVPEVVVPPVPEPVQPAAEELAKEPIAQPTPAVQPAPQAPVKPQKPAKPPYKRKAGTVIVSILLCILVFLFATVLTVLLSLREATTKESGTQLVSDMFQSVDVTQIPAASLVADADYEGSLADWIVEKAKEQNKGVEQFDQGDFEDYLAESAMVQQLSEQMGSLVWNVRQDDRGEELKAEDIRTLLENDRELIQKHLHFNISEKDIDKVVAEMENAKVLDYMSVRTLRREASGVFYATQYGLSLWVLIVIAVLTVGAMLLVCMANRWKFIPISNDLGVTLTLSGSLILLPSLVLMGFGGLLFQSLEGLSFIGSVISGLMGNFLIPSLIVFATGVVLLIAKTIGKKIVMKKATR